MKKITNLPVHEEGEVVTCSKEFIMWNKIQELTDAHNELAKIVGLLLKRDEENCLEKAKAELLETHTVKEVCICYQLSRHSKDPEMFCSCQCHGTKEEPTTPEKKCCDKDAICNKCAIQTSSYEVTCGGNEKIRKCDCGGPPKTNHSAACAIFR